MKFLLSLSLLALIPQAVMAQFTSVPYTQKVLGPAQIVSYTFEITKKNAEEALRYRESRRDQQRLKVSIFQFDKNSPRFYEKVLIPASILQPATVRLKECQVSYDVASDSQSIGIIFQSHPTAEDLQPDLDINVFQTCYTQYLEQFEKTYVSASFIELSKAGKN